MASCGEDFLETGLANAGRGVFEAYTPNAATGSDGRPAAKPRMVKRCGPNGAARRRITALVASKEQGQLSALNLFMG